MQRGEGAQPGVEDVLLEEGVSALDFDVSTWQSPPTIRRRNAEQRVFAKRCVRGTRHCADKPS